MIADFSTKKVRGYRRKVKQLEHFQNINGTPEFTETLKTCVLKFLVPPWNNHLPPHAPNWFNRRYIQCLSRLYEKWNCFLAKNFKDYYLAIWFNEGNPMKSQLVAAVDEHRDFYMNVFMPAPESQAKKSGETLDLMVCMSQKMEWYAVWDEDAFLEKTDGDIYLDCEIELIKEQAHRSEFIESTKENCYYLLNGKYWIGTSANS